MIEQTRLVQVMISLQDWDKEMAGIARILPLPQDYKEAHVITRGIPVVTSSILQGDQCCLVFEDSQTLARTPLFIKSGELETLLKQ